ncbi:MAG: polysaccharide deacetylase family protein [Bryobacterales bacterium]|nr:polysaccharide deacetylase family protein [Bryobacterales bacterium]
MRSTRRSFLLSATAASLAAQPAEFTWPDRCRAAVSLTFDDGRTSQIDRGIPFLNKLGARATFYLTPRGASQRVEGWKAAHAHGHDLGHHSNSHPCTANYRFSKANALEDYTLDRMAADLDSASIELRDMLGIKPVSFAYPCGQKFVGRGANAASYIPLIAKRFRSGRGYLDEAANDPTVCDLANLMGTGFDGLDAVAMRELLAVAIIEKRWLIFVGHDMGEAAHQSTDLRALENLIRFAQDATNGVWLATVSEVSEYIAKRRG